ncbi:MAG: glycosyltransferase family 2 protein [Ignavibacteria bacterium]|jgi:succinoglycan biosynthesis protein ExoA
MSAISTSLVSVIIPCRNERYTIEHILDNLQAQTYQGEFEVVIADGMSTDGTREFIASLVNSRAYSFAVQVVANEKKTIPSGLNTAVRASRGDVIIRVDCHARISTDYIERIFEALQQPGFDLVGPSIRIIAGNASPVAEAISVLTSSKLGSGGSASRTHLTHPVQVAHAAMSSYRRHVWERLGGYDESLYTNEDFDFDYRATQLGAGVYSLPRPMFYTMARPTLKGLAQQRWRYGWWKAAVLRKYPQSIHARQAIPILALVALVTLGAASLGDRAFLEPLLFGMYMYAAVCVLSALHTLSTGSDWKGGVRTAVTTVLLSPVIYAIIHGIWAVGALVGVIGNRLEKA